MFEATSGGFKDQLPLFEATTGGFEQSEKLLKKIKVIRQRGLNSQVDIASVSQPTGRRFDPGWEQFFFYKILQTPLK